MRFDDSLETVLAAEMAGPAGIQSAWRQLVDLIGRRRGGAPAGAIERLRRIRDDVPQAVRAASARGLERANPPAALVALFADDDVAVAGPVVRSARLTADEWIALLPTMNPATRGVLRHRRDLSDRVVAALTGFGPSDLALPAGDLTDTLLAPQAPVPALTAAPPAPPIVSVLDTAEPAAFVAPEPDPFVPLADIARDLPVVAAAMRMDRADPASSDGGFASWLEQVEASSRTEENAGPAPVAPESAGGEDFSTWLEQAGQVPPPVTQPEPAPAVEPTADASEAAIVQAGAPADAPDPVPAETEREAIPPTADPVADVAQPEAAQADAAQPDPAPPASAAPAQPATPHGDDFAIASLVARIEAHQRAAEARPLPAAAAARAPDRFRFETDASGLIRWCEGVERGPVVGLSLANYGAATGGAIDGVAGGAFARRARFDDARLVVPGSSTAAGAWRISATPAFDRASGRFTGYRGTARRPRPDEEPRLAAPSPATDALRQLVHELRTPANAISGFAEMIEREMLGAVPPAYREQAAAIRVQTQELLGAIDDIDTAARLESGRLDLRREAVPLVPILSRVATDLNPLAALRQARLDLTADDNVVAAGDAVALERAIARLLTAVVASAGVGEALSGALARDGDRVTLTLTRPAALAANDGALFGGEVDDAPGHPGAPLLGADFAFRLARRLAVELGGTLLVTPERLTLRLPAAVDGAVEQATV